MNMTTLHNAFSPLKRVAITLGFGVFLVASEPWAVADETLPAPGTETPKKPGELPPKPVVNDERPPGGDGSVFFKVFVLRNDKNGNLDRAEVDELHRSRMADPFGMRQRISRGETKRPPVDLSFEPNGETKARDDADIDVDQNGKVTASEFQRSPRMTAAETMQGVSFLPVTKNDKQVRKYAFSEHNWRDYGAHGRSVRDDDGWIYIRNARPEKGWIGPADSFSSLSHVDLQKLQAAGKPNAAQADVLLEPRPSEELYFTPDNPLQINNLVDDKMSAERLSKLRQIMDQWQEETGDSVPENYSPDYFDRQTGYKDSVTGKQITKVRNHQPGDAAGFDRGSAMSNAPGPR